MKQSIKILIALALLAGIVFTGIQVVQAASIAEKPSFPASTKQEYCIVNGGTWSGSSASIGTCTYSPGSQGHTDIGQCTDTQYAIVTYGVAYEPAQKGMHFSRTLPRPEGGTVSFSTTSCKDIPTTGGPSYGKCGNEASKTPEAVTVITCQGVSVAFDAGTCTGKCTVGPKLLKTAEKGLSQLDGEVLGQAYVKVRNPGGGSYKICFPGEGTIYKWVGGTWVAQATSTAGGQSCTFGSGDGNYVLVAE